MAPSKIVLIRHGEKINDDLPQLSPLGWLRAGMLVTFFQKGSQFGNIDAIYACKPKHKGSSIRPQQTVMCVSQDWNLDINLNYERESKEDAENPNYVNGVRTPKKSDQTKMATEILGKKFNGDTVLICWEHNSIPDLIVSLGGPDIHEWGHSYDRTIILNYHNDHFQSMSETTQWPLPTYPPAHP